MQTQELVPGEARLEVGGVVLSFVPTTDNLRLDLSDRHRPFVSCTSPDVTLHVRHGPAPYTDLGSPIFDSGGNWTLHHVQGQPVIRVRALGLDPYQLVVLEPDFQRGDIYCVGDVWARDGAPRSALGYPLEEVLVINLLARGRGVLLHACGICDEGRGILFAGTSGAGKSTLASLWEGREGVTVLSDDRVIVREREGRFWAHGTPWHGDARVLSPEAAPLEQVFLIQHADEHRAVPLQPLDAASRLLVRSFPTFWDAEGMAFTLDFLGRLTQAVPCFELGFIPDSSIVDFVRCATVV